MVVENSGGGGQDSRLAGRGLTALAARGVGGAVPGEADVDITAPAIQGVLRDGTDLEPPQGRQMAARGFDTAAIDLKDLRDPRGFAPPTADTAQRAGVGIQAPDEVPEDGGDDGGPAAQGEEAKRGAGDGHAAVEVGDGGTHGGEARAVGDPPQRGGGGGKRDTGAGPGE